MEQLRGRLGFVALLRWLRMFAAPWDGGAAGAVPAVCTWGDNVADDLQCVWLMVLGDDGIAWLRRTQWSLLPPGAAVGHEHHVSVSDVSGAVGAGGVNPRGDFARLWAIFELPHHINVKELAATIETLLTILGVYENKRLILDLDNSGAVFCINKGSIKIPAAHGMFRLLACVAVEKGMDVRARHRPGTRIVVSSSFQGRTATVGATRAKEWWPRNRGGSGWRRSTPWTGTRM